MTPWYRSPRRERGLLALLLGSAVGLTSGRALASPSFPRVIDETLALGCEPTCMLCHKGTTGFGTTNTPFGAKMRRETRLSCCDDQALQAALETFRERGIDSDEDGTPDVDELIAETDPNGDGPLECEPPFVSDGKPVTGLGCSLPAAPPSGPADDATALALGALAVGLVVRARARRR